MKIKLSLFLSIISWFAIIAQYYLMVQNRVESIFETTIRFFSFFTILTNLIVAIYFTIVIFKIRNIFNPSKKISAVLTAITVYITTVGLVYQIILRQLWHPTGLQIIVDELLHTIIPFMVIIYWYFYENKSLAKYIQIPKWLLYPLIYLIFILIRGKISDYYPYPFIHVGNIGLSKVLINSIILIGLFSGLSAVIITIGKVIKKISEKPAANTR